MKALIFCDIDGCLSIGKSHAFDLSRLAEIRLSISRLAKMGIGFTLCTGRPQPYAEAMAQVLGTELPLVSEGGALVYKPAADSYHPQADADSVRSITDLQAEIHASDLLGDGLYFEVGNAHCICLTGPAIAERGHAVVRATLEKIKERYASYPVSWSHSASSVDITPRGINKGSGVRAICEELGVDVANTACIGDSNGDIGMFKVAAFGYCPSNASDELKSFAKYVSDHSVIAGTLDILNEIERNPAFI